MNFKGNLIHVLLIHYTEVTERLCQSRLMSKQTAAFYEPTEAFLLLRNGQAVGSGPPARASASQTMTVPHGAF